MNGSFPEKRFGKGRKSQLQIEHLLLLNFLNKVE